MTTISHHFHVAHTAGTPGLLAAARVIEAPIADQVLIRMGAASLNYRDLLVMQDPGANPAGLIPLSDGAGTVVAVGDQVTRWKKGDRVSPSFFPGWVSGAFSGSYLSNALGGGQADGVLSEFIIAREAALVEVAEHLSLAEAATLPCAGLTAWHALFERGALESGQTVLVQGTGGVALFGLQLATAHGARVIVTSSSDAKLERARSLGAWATINYRTFPDWDKVAMEITEGKGVDHILELGGAGTYDRSIAAVAAGGQIAQVGVLSGFNSQLRIPRQTGHRFHAKLDSDSTAIWTVIPEQTGQQFVAA